MGCRTGHDRVCSRPYCRCYRARSGCSCPLAGQTDAVGSTDYRETVPIGGINTTLSYDQGEGSNQAVGAVVFQGGASQRVTRMVAYVVQDGDATGSFQMAILQPVSIGSAVVLAVTAMATSVTSGIYELSLISSVVLAQGSVYYLAVYNQVNDSQLGAYTGGLNTTQDAPPINFRVQNISGFSVRDTVDTSDVSLQITPWLAAY